MMLPHAPRANKFSLNFPRCWTSLYTGPMLALYALYSATYTALHVPL